MFSGSLGRVVRQSNTSIVVAVRPSGCLTAIRPLHSSSNNSPSGNTFFSSSPPSSGGNHQRRHSSSKTSIPPDGSKRAAPSQQASGSSGRVSRRKAKEPAPSPVEARKNQPFSKQYPNLPSVPSTQHLRPKDINVSSFFSLHRPISVTTAIPHPSTEAEFNSLFEPRSPSKEKKKYDDVIFTLNNLVENMDPYAEQDEDGSSHLNWQALNEPSTGENGATRHLDSVPRDIPLDKIISQFRPYKAPPPPQPFTDSPASASTKPSTKKRASKARTATSSSRQKRTTIIVTLTEYTDPSGEKSYAASGTPIIRVPQTSNEQNSTVVVQNQGWEEYKPAMRQPFLDRMRIRQQRWQDYREDRAERTWGEPESGAAQVVEDGAKESGREMLLISVKRQRKLKMKKHKYKKLMRKTRNLRRKLGKL